MPRKKTGEKGPQQMQEVPSHEQIRKLAYEFYLACDGGTGSELEDWLKAERELASRKKSTPRRQKRLPRRPTA